MVKLMLLDLPRVLIFLLTSGCLWAQWDPGTSQAQWNAGSSQFEGDVPVVAPVKKNENRFSLGWKVLNNVDVTFGKVGANSPNRIPPATGGVDHFYDDGFNRVDSSGNAGGLTWFWGYQNASQFNPAGGGTISMNIANGATRASTSQTEDFNPGVELAYRRRLADFSRGEAEGEIKTSTNLGVRAAFSYNRLDSSESSILPYLSNVVTDTFALNGVIPPPAPYSGPFAGPGPLLSDTPTRTTALRAATITGSSSLEANIFQIKAGPYVELDVADRLSVSLTGGITIAPIESEYSFAQTALVPGILTQTSTGNNSRLATVFGAYAEVSAAIRVVDSVEVFASSGYNYLKNYEVQANGNNASLNFSTAWTFDAGVAYRF